MASRSARYRSRLRIIVLIAVAVVVDVAIRLLDRPARILGWLVDEQTLAMER